jgi:hypothetical protein
MNRICHERSDTPYLPAGDPAADLMFAYKVSPNCEGEANCLELSVGDCMRLTLDETTLLGIDIRTCLEPATKVGPALTEMLGDGVTKVSPPSP